jgi:hypothetical protein
MYVLHSKFMMKWKSESYYIVYITYKFNVLCFAAESMNPVMVLSCYSFDFIRGE